MPAHGGEECNSELLYKRVAPACLVAQAEGDHGCGACPCMSGDGASEMVVRHAEVGLRLEEELSRVRGRAGGKVLETCAQKAVQGVDWECDHKRARTLLGEINDHEGWGRRQDLASPLSEDRPAKLDGGRAVTSCMPQNRPDRSVTPRVLSQHEAAPREGADLCLERTIRRLSPHPGGILVFTWTDIDWSGDV